MTTYKCLDCGSDMEYEQGLYWNNTLSECFYKFNCPKCGSKFEHRLSREEEEELTERGMQREIKCVSCGRTDLVLPPLAEYMKNDLKYDSVIILCNECRNVVIDKIGMYGYVYVLDIKPKSSTGWLKLLWRKIKGK